jgi:hypothetical protein
MVLEQVALSYVVGTGKNSLYRASSREHTYVRQSDGVDYNMFVNS